MPKLRQNKNSKLFLIGGPFCYGEIPGVQAFGYDPQRTLQRRGTNTFSGDGPVGITDNFEGVTGQFEVDGVDAEKAVMAYASRQLLSSFASYHPSNNMPVFIVAKCFDDDGVTPIGCDFIDNAKIGTLTRGVQTGNARFPFEALNYKEIFDNEIVIEEFDGSASPVVSLATASDTNSPAVALENKAGVTYYALAVLIQTNSGTKIVSRLLKAAAAAPGYFSEAVASGKLTITLHADDGLTTGEKALVVYAKAAAALDSTPPTISSVSPTDGAAAVAVGSDIVWTFSEAIQDASVNSSNFILMKASDGTTVAGTLSIDSTKKIVTLNPTVDLTAATPYIAVATGVKDLAGNVMAAASITNFTTA